MKNVTILFILFCSLTRAQSLYCKVETTFEGMLAIQKDKKAIIEYYSKDDKYKTEIKDKGDLINATFYNGEDVFIYSKEKRYNLLCARGTKKELAEQNQENANKYKTKYDKFEVEKTDKTKTILGYECKQAIIKTTQSAMGFKSKSESIIWYTDKLNQASSSNDASTYGTENEMTKAIQSLGMALEQEQYINGKKICTIKVLDIKENTLTNDDFAEYTKDCKKEITLKEYKAEMDKREAQRQSSSFR